MKLKIIMGIKFHGSNNMIKIGERIIGENQKCFVIAEGGVNHNGDIEIAKQLVDVAVDAQCNAVKFQTFKPVKSDFPNESMEFFKRWRNIPNLTYDEFVEQAKDLIQTTAMQTFQESRTAARGKVTMSYPKIVPGNDNSFKLEDGAFIGRIVYSTAGGSIPGSRLQDEIEEVVKLSNEYTNIHNQ